MARHEWDNRFKVMLVKRLVRDGEDAKPEVVILGFIPRDQRMVDTILACTTCELCNQKCSENLPIESSWLKLRGKLIHKEKKMTFPPFEMLSAALEKEGNIWAGYRKNRMDWFPKDLEARHGPGHKAKAVYFAGCTASYIENDIGIASVRLLDEALEAGVDKVLALCPCCQFQLRVSAEKKNMPLEVVDLAHYAAEALGYKMPDPNPEVQSQWAVFEAMIPLMTPQGFADLMGTMWAELIDAMPLGMGSMMRLMGKIPLALPLMKPLFPVLFPVLLPRMIPKLLPVMLERIKEKIPMPGYMAEQMPELMPKVMDNLMPHMIKDLVPLVSQPMIEDLCS